LKRTIHRLPLPGMRIYQSRVKTGFLGQSKSASCAASAAS
jgi:hypothetical protein